MNRRERRAQRQQRGVAAAHAYAAAYACPDCNAEKRLVQHAPGVLGLVIAHDDTCPWLAQHQP